jgi:DNA-binding NarL/FixJ family response regulator
MSDNGAVRVMVVDMHPVFAEALAVAINTAESLSCVGVASDAEGALRMADEVKADVIVMDVRLYEDGAMEATRTLVRRHPETRVLALSERNPTASMVQAVVDAGASALLPKTTSLDVVVDTIPALTEHCFTMDRNTVNALCGPTSPYAARRTPSTSPLTRREHDILAYLDSGVDLQSAAARLGITINTARGYMKNLYRKLGVHNQLELLAVARERGLLESGR